MLYTANITTTRTIDIHRDTEEERWKVIREKYIGGGSGGDKDTPHPILTATPSSTVSLFVGGTYDDEDTLRDSTGTSSLVYLRLVQEDGTIHHVRMRANTPFSWLVLSGYEGFHIYFRHRRLKWSHTPLSQGFDTLQSSPDFPVSLFLVPAKPRDVCLISGHRIGGLGTSTINVLLVPKWQILPNDTDDANANADADADDGGITIEKLDDERVEERGDGDEPAEGRKLSLRCILPCAINTIIDTLCTEGVITYEAALDLHISTSGAEGEDGNSSAGMVACKRTKKGLYEMITSHSILKEGDELYLGGV